MGGASSKNVAEGVAKVLTNVSNNTHASVTDVQEQINSFEGCIGPARVAKIKQANARESQLSNLAKMKADTSVQSELQQQMMQEAMSKVGSLGVGMASASNFMSMYAEASTNILNSLSSDVSSSSTQKNFVDMTENCKTGNLNPDMVMEIDQGNDSKQVVQNVVEYSAVSNVTSQISQIMKQTASATVESAAMALFAIAAIIAALGYGVSSSVGAAAKPFVLFGVVIAAMLGVIYMSNEEVAPFFNKPQYLSTHFNFGKECEEALVDVDVRTLSIRSEPLQYAIGVVEPNKTVTGSLLSMAIANFATTEGMKYNGGYNMETMHRLDAYLTDLREYAKSVADKEVQKKIDTLFDIRLLQLPVSVKKEEQLLIPPDYVVYDKSNPPRAGVSADDNPGQCTPRVLRWTTNPSKTAATDCMSARFLVTHAKADSEPREVYAYCDEHALLKKDENDLRFLLCLILFDPKGTSGVSPIKFNLNIYKNDSDLVMYRGEQGFRINLASNLKNTEKTNCFEDVGSKRIKLQGNCGVCPDTAYKLTTTAKNVALPAMLGLFATSWYMSRSSQTSSDDTSKATKED